MAAIIMHGVRVCVPLLTKQYFFQDLPIVAIDSFKHMYLFPKFDDIK